MTRAIRRLRAQDGERGAYAVEFAFVAPIIFLIVAFGYSMTNAVWSQAELNRVAELVSRAVAVPDSISALQGREHRTFGEIKADVQAVSPDTAGSFSGEGTPLTFELYDEAGALIIGADDEVPALREGEAFTVRVTKPFENPMGRLLAGFGGPEISGGTIVAERVGVRE